MSYNHADYFYRYLDKEQGLRFIYGKHGRDVLPFLLKMRETLRGSPTWTVNYYGDRPLLDTGMNKNDGWSLTLGNAYWNLQKIIDACIKNPTGKWMGD